MTFHLKLSLDVCFTISLLVTPGLKSMVHLQFVQKKKECKRLVSRIAQYALCLEWWIPSTWGSLCTVPTLCNQVLSHLQADIQSNFAQLLWTHWRCACDFLEVFEHISKTLHVAELRDFSIMFVCLFTVVSPAQEYFTYMETSPLPEKGNKI
jgi:hypothetical protein